jgi:membrane protease YdiL (CAAX protease family)
MECDMEITHLHPILLIILVILLALIRYAFEKMVSRIFKLIPIERTSVQLFTRGFILIFFNIAVLALFGLLKGGLSAFAEPRTGMVILTVGLGFGIIVALLSLLAIKAGFGGGYNSLVAVSSLDKSLTLATFILLAGPSEDIFFIGFAQNALTPSLGWGAIIVYIVLFIAYHYANVISGVEKKKEFFGTLPVRLMVSLLLSISFYLTGTLVYGVIVHNLIDTLSYVALLYAVRQKQAQISSP